MLILLILLIVGPYKLVAYRKLYSDNRERSLRLKEADLRLPLLETVDGQKAFSYRGAKVVDQFRKRSNIGTFAENSQGAITEGGVAFTSVSI